ncbi:hypothetical protein [uncultured Ruminococcus sp.]|uniref:hypothetical protein n=1 Tax=uncultured Ruminococcus sp. TaxID=165186 RepID=UPI002930780F|nr:hypothetical protein [uncultured Ruminococcus sp.]
MKKSKVVLAIVLAVVLLIAVWNVPTFSWFSRPHSQNGAQAVLGGSNGAYSINAYNGYNVSIATYPSNDGFTYSTTATTNYSGSNIPNNNRKYFKTTLTNNSGGEQNVSLYARTLSIPTANNGSLAIGVNGPTRSYHDYSTLAADTADATRDAMRIYFQKPKSAPDGWAGTEFYICWNEDTNTSIASLDSTGSNGTYYKMTYCGEKDNYYNYYVDIPKTATHAFFACENWAEGKQQSDLTADNWKKRTQTIKNLYGAGQSQLQSKIYKLTSTIDYGNTKVETPPDSVDGACINHFYSSIFVKTGSTYNAGLDQTTKIPTREGYTSNYIGTLEYYSGDTNVFTVDKTTGVITPVGAGEATLYTKAVGSSYSDSQQVETTVKVTAADNYVFNDVPIVKNVKMAANETVDVNWYVINNSPTTALTYTIDEVYVSN